MPGNGSAFLKPMRYVLLCLIVAIPLLSNGVGQEEPYWSEAELKVIASLSLAALRDLRPDQSNAVGDNADAAALGKALFSDTRLSANGEVACASCHQAELQFQDGLRVGHGVGDGNRRTMPIAGTAYFPFFFWDGRKDSQWSQALGPMENPVEHGADRTMIVRLVTANYAAEYEALFGAVPALDGFPEHAAPAGSPDAVAAWDLLTDEQRQTINRAYSNIGKAIAAFERTIPPPATRFDDYAAALAANDEALANRIFTTQERNGLKLFVSPSSGPCVSCHSGPQFTDAQFYNVGLAGMTAEADSGRSTSVKVLKDDPFNCLGEFSDAPASACQQLRYMRRQGNDLVAAFKSPSLRGVAQRPPYLHNGSFATLHDVLLHYNEAPAAVYGMTKLTPMKMTEAQLGELEAFLHTLDVLP